MTLQELIAKLKAKQAEKPAQKQPDPEAVKAFMERIKALKEKADKQ